MKRVYLILAIIGFVVPYYFFVSFLLEYGLDLGELFDQLLVNDISTFFVADLIITAIVFLIFSYQESKRRQMGNWLVYLVTTLLVGPSFSFPLFFFSFSLL